MLVYLVTAEVSRARSLKALAGWRVFNELGWAIREIEEWWLQKSRGRLSYQFEPAYRSKANPSIFVTDVNEDILEPMAGNVNWPALREPVAGWRRVNQDDYLVFTVEQKMAGQQAPVMEACWVGTIVRTPGKLKRP